MREREQVENERRKEIERERE